MSNKVVQIPSLLSDDRLLAIRTDRNNRNGHTEVRLDEADVFVERLGEVCLVTTLCHVGLPPLEALVEGDRKSVV